VLQACALFLFPTKALAQDQLRVLRQLLCDAFGPDAPSVDVYDGDTPQQQRPLIRQRAQLLITNPDMLHQSILPCHSNFGRLLASLTFVVVDEVRGCVCVERSQVLNGSTNEQTLIM
jgi:DEAD/DEAH box helicase domain-containing protein